MNDIMFAMRYSKNIIKVCSDEEFSYYEIAIMGVVVMFRQVTLRPDGRRFYYLNNQLAKLLGFGDLYWLMKFYPHIQYWRKFISVHSLSLKLKIECSFIQSNG